MYDSRPDPAAKQYADLHPLLQAAYDLLGQRGFDHEACMEGVGQFQDSVDWDEYR
jgi:hypothetical protein